MRFKRTNVLLGAIGLGSLLLVGCASNVSTSTMVSPPLMLPAQASSGKSVYVQVRNVTSQNVSSLQSSLTQMLQKEGYTIASDRLSANTVITVDVLQAGKSTMTGLNTAMLAGVGGPITNEPQSVALVPADSNVRVSITNAAAQNLTYSLTSDVMYSFKTASNTSQVQAQQQGNAAPASFSVTQTNWNNYSNRVIAYATQANVPFNQAMTALINSVVTQINNTLPQ